MRTQSKLESLLSSRDNFIKCMKLETDQSTSMSSTLSELTEKTFNGHTEQIWDSSRKFREKTLLKQQLIESN